MQLGSSGAIKADTVVKVPNSGSGDGDSRALRLVAAEGRGARRLATFFGGAGSPQADVGTSTWAPNHRHGPAGRAPRGETATKTRSLPPCEHHARNESSKSRVRGRHRPDTARDRRNPDPAPISIPANRGQSPQGAPPPLAGNFESRSRYMPKFTTIPPGRQALHHRL